MEEGDEICRVPTEPNVFKHIRSHSMRHDIRNM